MNWKWAFVGAFASLATGPWTASAQDRPVFRAQNEVYHDGGYYADDCDDYGHCGPLGHCSRCWRYVTTLGGPMGSGYYRRDPRQLDFTYLYRYKAPKDLRYPPANQPAGVVVYPYYTVKGPDDFFLNETLGN